MIRRRTRETTWQLLSDKPIKSSPVQFLSHLMDSTKSARYAAEKGLYRREEFTYEELFRNKVKVGHKCTVKIAVLNWLNFQERLVNMCLWGKMDGKWIAEKRYKMYYDG